MGRACIRTFPNGDAAFAIHVEIAHESLQNDDMHGLVERVRLAYPLAEIHKASPDGQLDHSQDVWYLFRDGGVRAARRAPWSDDESVAVATLSPDGRYVDANDAAAKLFGVDREDIIGRPAGSFTVHEPDPPVGERLLETARRVGSLDSTAVVLRPDGERWPIAFRVVASEDGHEVYMRRTDDGRL